MVCTGYDLKNLESLLSTAVGVGFILPVVYQMLVERANKLQTLSRTLMEELEAQNDRLAVRDLASVRLAFQLNLQKIEGASGTFIIVSSISSLIAFALIVLNTYKEVCLSSICASAIIFSVSVPVLFCAGIFFWWIDSSRQLYGRCKYYYNH